jgi:GDP-L-fucose synthase
VTLAARSASPSATIILSRYVTLCPRSLEPGGRVNVLGKSIVITGGTGFLGARVNKELETAGAHVFALGHTDFDLRDRPEIDRMLRELHPDAVIHLAAVVGGIGANQASPGRFFYENAIMGIELLEACRLGGVEKVVVAGTVCAYPKFAPVPFREEDLWNGYPEETNAPYGLAKKMLLVQAQAYRSEYGMNTICLFPVNLYGPGDNFDVETGHVIPGMIRKFVEAKEAGESCVVLWGDGSPTREFLYVDDAARAFRLALERYDGAEPVNLGSGEEISIRDLAERVRVAVGFRGTVEWDTSRPNGQPRRRLETSRANDRFGFRSRTTFDVGLDTTIKWYRAHPATAYPR